MFYLWFYRFLAFFSTPAWFIFSRTTVAVDHSSTASWAGEAREDGVNVFSPPVALIQWVSVDALS